MTPNRVVAFLTPTVFAPAAGFCASWIAAHVPGTHVSSNDVQAIFIAGALIALAPAAQWLHGWQKYEARQADAEHEVEMANVEAAAAAPSIPDVAPADFGLDEGDDPDGMAILDELDGIDDAADELVPDEPGSAAIVG